MSQHSHQALPCQPFLFAQGAAQVGDDDQAMRFAVLTERTAAHSPSPGFSCRRAVEGPLQGPRRFALQTVIEAQLIGAPPEQLFRRAREQPLTGAVDQTQFPFVRSPSNPAATASSAPANKPATRSSTGSGLVLS